MRCMIHLLIGLVLTAGPVEAATFTFTNEQGNGSIRVADPRPPDTLFFQMTGDPLGAATSQRYTAKWEHPRLPGFVQFNYVYTPRESSSISEFGAIISLERNLTVRLGANEPRGGFFAYTVRRGDIFGWYLGATRGGLLDFPFVQVNARIAPVPAPAALVVLLTGVAALTALAGLRRRQA